MIIPFSKEIYGLIFEYFTPQDQLRIASVSMIVKEEDKKYHEIFRFFSQFIIEAYEAQRLAAIAPSSSGKENQSHFSQRSSSGPKSPTRAEILERYVTLLEDHNGRYVESLIRAPLSEESLEYSLGKVCRLNDWDAPSFFNPSEEYRRINSPLKRYLNIVEYYQKYRSTFEYSLYNAKEDIWGYGYLRPLKIHVKITQISPDPIFKSDLERNWVIQGTANIFFDSGLTLTKELRERAKKDKVEEIVCINEEIVSSNKEYLKKCSPSCCVIQ